MDHYSILDQSSSPATQPGPEPALETAVPHTSTIRTSPSSISAAIAAANAMAAENTGTLAYSSLRFPGEDGGRSLAGMAQRDLDAALQLLAERAQYITGASGAAIALRRSQSNDMLCRASVGTNAPELGALLSAEAGLSGESVRTRLPLRCDDVERDPRVNRDGCRELGIASVVVMPIVRDDQVLGVFELFSGKASAFGERDISALQRLGEMVDTAVKLAETTQGVPLAGPAEVAAADSTSQKRSIDELSVNEIPYVDAEVEDMETEISAPESKVEAVAPEVADVLEVAAAAPTPISPSTEPPPKPALAKKPLMWSATLHTSQDAQKAQQADQSHVPPVLRNLHKCWACGFPVSEGRKLCVECEEKQWRGQLRIPDTPGKDVPAQSAQVRPAASLNLAMAAAAAVAAAPLPRSGTFPPVHIKPEVSTAAPIAPAAAQTTAPVPAQALHASDAEISENESDLPNLSGGMERSESWLSANKYIVGALLVVVAAVAAIVFLR